MAVKVSGVGGADTGAKEGKLLYRKTIRVPIIQGLQYPGPIMADDRYFLGLIATYFCNR
ncbi:hypothetical protein [Peribacillus sp. FSL E2-0218]|uniref:hypothetical protein n=1 Tax=Peribacillus sp. FSL E2-0218 TaxID=2921364 RepID=UPI000AB94BB4